MVNADDVSVKESDSKEEGMAGLQLKCGGCGLPQAALEPIWGAHHGRFRVSIYTCEGTSDRAGCGRIGQEVFDEYEHDTYLFGCLEKEEPIPFTEG